MKRIFKTILLASFLLIGNGTLANPQDNAVYIANRHLTPELLDLFREAIGRQFVVAYSKPMLRLSIDVADEDHFLELIPEEDIAQFVERFRDQIVEAYLSDYTVEQLAAISDFLRADEEAMVEDVFSEGYKEKYTFAQISGIGLEMLFAPAMYTAEIKGYEYEMNNPVTVAALTADGVFNFANPVQQQTLLRQISNSQSTGGIQFIQAPTHSDD
jgi:hypothetical protein